MRAYHFVDDTNILLSNKSLELLAKKMNQDLKDLMQCLKANKLSLNIKKTELIIFLSKNTKLDYGVKSKLSGRRLTPISTVKYLGILLDEHLSWTKQVNWVNSEPSNWNSEVQHKLTYFKNCLSLFIWITSTIWRPTLGTRKLCKSNIIQNLQNQALRKITFKKFCDTVNLLSKDLNFLNSKISFTFKTVFLYCKLNKIRHL